jgi:aryl-alcohol dehydrogenase-like predicted oxidoreductase
VDLYQIHRWDYETPIEETMEALHDVVRAGKARCIRASAMFAWQFQKALARRRKERLDPLRLDAGSLEPDLPRRRARDVPSAARRRSE